jgi:hypothetical protein
LCFSQDERSGEQNHELETLRVIQDEDDRRLGSTGMHGGGSQILLIFRFVQMTEQKLNAEIDSLRTELADNSKCTRAGATTKRCLPSSRRTSARPSTPSKRRRLRCDNEASSV